MTRCLAGQKKSTTYGPIGACRLKCVPFVGSSFKARHGMRSCGVVFARSFLAAARRINVETISAATPLSWPRSCNHQHKQHFKPTTWVTQFSFRPGPSSPPLEGKEKPAAHRGPALFRSGVRRTDVLLQPHFTKTYFPFFTVSRMRERSSRPLRSFSVKL
jgi:hypothetical protein